MIKVTLKKVPSLKDHHQSEEYIEEGDPSKEYHDTHNATEDLQDAYLRIENMHDMSESPIEDHEDEHNEIEAYIQERVLKI